MSTLPKTINAMKVISYDVQQIVENIHDWQSTPFEEITLDMVMDWIEDSTEEDFVEISIKTIYQDDSGESL